MTHDSSQRTILVVGPDPGGIGGMATVMRQMMSMECSRGWRLRGLSFTQSVDPHERWSSRVRRHIRQSLRLAHMIRRERAAIVHFHTCSGTTFWRTAIDAVLARMLCARVILHIHGAMFDKYCAQCGRAARRMIRFILERADAVVALSESWATKLARIAPHAKLHVIPNAIDAGTIDVPPASTLSTGDGDDHRRGHDPREPRPCRLLMLARMDEWKGVGDLLDACAWLKRRAVAFELVLAGPEGTAGDADRLRARIATAGLTDQVRYVGPVEGDAKERLLRWTDVLVQPSHHEGLPMSVLEAMVRGRVVVAACVGALPEVLHGELATGLVNARQPEQLAATLTRVCGDAALRRRLGDLGAEYVRERFSLDRFRQAMASLYAQVAPADGSSHPVPVPQAWRTADQT